MAKLSTERAIVRTIKSLEEQVKVTNEKIKILKEAYRKIVESSNKSSKISAESILLEFPNLKSKRGRKSKMSDEEKQEVSKRMKAYWAKRRAEKQSEKNVKSKIKTQLISKENIEETDEKVLSYEEAKMC